MSGRQLQAIAISISIFKAIDLSVCCKNSHRHYLKHQEFHNTFMPFLIHKHNKINTQVALLLLTQHIMTSTRLGWITIPLANLYPLQLKQLLYMVSPNVFQSHKASGLGNEIAEMVHLSCTF